MSGSSQWGHYWDNAWWQLLLVLSIAWITIDAWLEARRSGRGPITRLRDDWARHGRRPRS